MICRESCNVPVEFEDVHKNHPELVVLPRVNQNIDTAIEDQQEVRQAVEYLGPEEKVKIMFQLLSTTNPATLRSDYRSRSDGTPGKLPAFSLDIHKENDELRENLILIL